MLTDTVSGTPHNVRINKKRKCLTEFFCLLQQNMPNSIGMTKAAAKHNKAKEDFFVRYHTHWLRHHCLFAFVLLEICLPCLRAETRQ